MESGCAPCSERPHVITAKNTDRREDEKFNEQLSNQQHGDELIHSHDLPPSLLVTLSLGWIVRDQFVVSGGAPKEGIEVCYKDHCTPALAR